MISTLGEENSEGIMSGRVVQPRSKIQMLLEALKNELECLPGVDIFGDSNAEGKIDSEEWIHELASALNYKLVVNPNSEAYQWLIGSSSGTLGGDYGIR